MDSDKGRNVGSVKKRLFLNASWLFGGKTVASVFIVLQTIIIARILGVNDYGLLAMVVAYVDVLNNLFDFRVWETATKYIGTFWVRGEREKTLSMIKLSYVIDISSGILAFIISILTAKLASSYIIHSPGAYTLIWIYSLSLFIDTASSTSNAILRVFDRYKQIAFVSSFISVFRLILVFLLLYLGMGISGVLFSFVAATFTEFLIRLWIVSKTLREYSLTGWWRSDLSLIKDQWKGIAWFLGNTSLAATLKTTSDNFLGVLAVGYFAGKDAAAYYRIAKSFVKLTARLREPFYEAIYPELVRISSSDSLKGFKSLLKYSTKSLGKITIPLAMLVILFAEQIIRLAFGEQYIPSVNTMRVVVVAALILQLTFWTGPALLSVGRPALRTLMMLVSSVVYVALLLLLVPRFSYLGAAFAYLGYAVVRPLVSIIALKASITIEKERLSKLKATEPPL